jgi:hypothetical protein
MVRICAASAAAVIAATLALGFSAPALAGPETDGPVIRSSGMSSEFPVGRCIDVPNSVPMDFVTPITQLIYVVSVPCTDPNRDYRVVSQVAHENQCPAETSNIYHTNDVLVLCAVQDHG